MKCQGRMEGGLRKCISIKSRKKKNDRCTSSATNGDFCTKHYKNPIRFIPPHTKQIITRAEKQAIQKIQSVWSKWSAFNKFKTQGPCYFSTMFELSNNTSEVYSMEPLITIPSMYIFSFADENKYIWVFDIRSLSHLLTTETVIQNPYTRTGLSSKVIKKIDERIKWLQHRKYPTFYMTTENMTHEQIWNQKVLDVFFKMEHLGYRSSCCWFENMTITDHENFYRKLYYLWFIRLGLTRSEKEAILQEHDTIFHNHPDKYINGMKDLRWWRRTNLHIILDFLTKSPQKNNQALGALYVLMVLVQIVDEAGEAYPWILDSVNES